MTGENTGGLLLGTTLLSGLDGTLAVDGVAEGVNDTAEESLADGDVDLNCLLVDVAIFKDKVAHTISPVRLTVSPSRTSLSEPKSTTPTWPASRFMHMPLTPEANLVWMLVADVSHNWAGIAIATYSTSSSAWTLFMP